MNDDGPKERSYTQQPRPVRPEPNLPLRFFFLAVAFSIAYAFAHFRGLADPEQSSLISVLYANVFPDYLANDFFLESARQLSADRYFLGFVIRVSTLFGEPLLGLPIAFAASLLLLTIALYGLARAYFPHSVYPMVFAIFLPLFAFEGLLSNLGALHAGAISPQLIGWCFIVLALNFLLRQKRVVGYFLLGLSVLFYPPVGYLSYSAILFTDVIPSLLRRDPRYAGLCFLKSLVFFVAASPSIALSVSLAADLDFSIEKTVLSAVDQTTLRFALAQFVLMIILGLWCGLGLTAQAFHARIWSGVFAILLLFGLSGLSERFLELDWLSLSSFLAWAVLPVSICVLYLTRFAFLVGTTTEETRERYLFFWVPFFFLDKATTIAGLLILFFELLARLPKAPQPFKQIWAVARSIVAPLAVAAVIYVAWVLPGWDRWSYLFDVLALYLLLETFKRVLPLSWVFLTLLAFPLSAVGLFIASGANSAQSCDLPPGLVEEIGYNSGANDLFLVPPSWTSFRVCTQRAVVVDNLRPPPGKALKAWSKRMADITASDTVERELRRLDFRYHHLAPEYLEALQEEYNFEFGHLLKTLIAAQLRR